MSSFNHSNTPYFAVIFTSTRTEGDNGYSDVANRMVELAKQQPGFLGMDSVREEVGITVSCWRGLDSIKQWKANTEHQKAQRQGKEHWYSAFNVRIVKVEQEYSFDSLTSRANFPVSAV